MPVRTIRDISLAFCDRMTPHGDIVLVNIGSSNGLLSDGNKPLSESMLIGVNLNRKSKKMEQMIFGYLG